MHVVGWDEEAGESKHDGSSSTKTTCNTERRRSGFVMSAEDYLDFASPEKRQRLGASQRATFSEFIEFHEHNFIVFSEA